MVENYCIKTNQTVVNSHIQLATRLMGTLPDNPFYIKDQELRYVACNRAMLQFCRKDEPGDLLGLRAIQVFPKVIGKYYEDLDTRVLKNRIAIEIPLEPNLFSPDQHWISYTLQPLIIDNAVFGVIGVARNLNTNLRQQVTYQRLMAAQAQIKQQGWQAFEIGTLAKSLHISISQLERDFKTYLGIKPSRYHALIRIQLASRSLVEGMSLKEIAHEFGFSDQSAFSRAFKKYTGLTPTQYMKQQNRESRL